MWVGMGRSHLAIQYRILCATRHHQVLHSICIERKGLVELAWEQGTLIYVPLNIKIPPKYILFFLDISLSLIHLMILLFPPSSETDCIHNQERLWKRGERSSMGCCTENSARTSTTGNLKHLWRKEQLQGALRNSRTSKEESWDG